MSNGSIDDIVGEGPHAEIGQSTGKKRRATWPFTASTLKMRENLTDVHWLSQSSQTPLEAVWPRHKDVVKFKRLDRGSKLTWKAFIAKVYTTRHLLGFRPGPNIDVPVDDGGDDPPPPPEGGGGADAVDGDLVDADDDECDDAFLSDEAKLLRDYYRNALPDPGSFITVPEIDADNTKSLKVLQIIAKEAKSKNPRTYVPVRHFNFKLSVLPWEVWRLPVGDLDVQELEIFNLENTSDFEFVNVFSQDGFDRTQVKVWTASRSDIEGCVNLSKPVVVAPTVPLSSDKVSVLSLVDALRAKGFTGVSRQVKHERGGPLIYDDRSIIKRRNYLQCVLAQEEIFNEPAVASFKSGLTAAFYLLLLKSPKDIRPGMTGRDCLKRLKELQGTAVESQMLKVSAGVATRAQLNPIPEAAHGQHDDDIAPDVGGGPVPPGVADDDNEIAGDPMDDVVVDEGPPHPGPATSSSSSSSSSPSSRSSSTSGDDVAPDAGMSDAEESDNDEAEVGDSDDYPPEEINGIHVTIERKHGNEGIRVACCNREHRAHFCKKFRSLHKDVDSLGPRAAEYYIRCWHSMSEAMPVDAHRAYQPTVAEVRAYMEALGLE